MMKSATISLAALLLCAACAKDKLDVTKPPTAQDKSNVSRTYERAIEEKKNQNYLDATAIFEYIKNNFPYSQYAALSELALADMQFDRDEHAASAAAYQDFVKAHPSHPKADYAAFQVGMSYYLEKPSDIFFLPPSYEKDQTPIRQALEAWNKMVVSYPKSDYVTKARDKINECRERLMAHDRYVAEFYTKHEGWRGAAGRWLSIADNFGDLQDGKVRGDSLWRAAQAYQKAKDPGDERSTLQRLVQESPNDPHRAQAEALLKQIPAEAPKTSVEKPPQTEPVKPPPNPASPVQQPEQETPSKAPPGK
jgi:outer membrane protein assembly factor BamD